MARKKKAAPLVVRSMSEGETRAIGERLSAACSGRERILIVGDLGAGKTVLIKGIAQGLGIRPERVRSPSYVTALVYPGPKRLLHIDLYRRDQPPADLAEEMEDFDGVVVVEWGDRAASLLSEHIIVHIVADESGDRVIELTAVGKYHAAVLKKWMMSDDQSSGH
jgi:tRNA threonylcarbamoyladenosine biosynthesis protein TsaE